MKKLILIILMVVPIFMLGQIWDYPIKPGTKAWVSFKTVDEMYKACQIPENVLCQLSTEDLVDICLNFPAPPLFLLFNTPQDCFMSFYSKFNGIRELFNRKDAGYYLIKRYSQMSLKDYDPNWELYKQGQFISHYKFIESILSQSKVIQLLTFEERKLLMNETLSKINEKLSNEGLFSTENVSINSLGNGKIIILRQ